MKLPAVAIAAVFAGGIALGLHPAVLPPVTSSFLLWGSFTSALILIVGGLALAKIERLFPAAIATLLSWASLGLLGACVAQQPRPANHVTSLLEQGDACLCNHRYGGRVACAMNLQSCPGATDSKGN